MASTRPHWHGGHAPRASADDVRELMQLIDQERRFARAFAEEVDRLTSEIEEMERLRREAAQRLDEASDNIAELEGDLRLARRVANDSLQ